MLPRRIDGEYDCDLGASSKLVVDEARRLGHPQVIAGPMLDQALAQVEEIVRPGDVLLTVGAGDVDRLAAAWLGGGS